MLVKLLEPLLVDDKIIDELSSKLKSKGHDFVSYERKPIDFNELNERISDADIAIVANYPVPDEILENAKKLKMLSVAFTGVDHIGLQGARNNKIKICNSAGYSDIAVAELAIGLTLNVLRNVQTCDRAARNQGTNKGLFGNTLNGKTVGIIGCGKIGKKTADLFNAFGCEVLGFSANQNEQTLNEFKIKKVDLDTLLNQSDIISLHIPANDETKNFIDEEKISKMKSSAILINTARGAVVDNDALANALNKGKIRGAGIDVFDMEPPIPMEYKLLRAKNILLTPHVAYATEESMVTRANIAFNNVISYLDGKLENEIV